MDEAFFMTTGSLLDIVGCLLLTYRPKRHSPLNIRIGMFAFSTVRFLIT